MISKSKLEEIRRSLYDDDGYTRINNPHFDLIFEEAFKAGMNHVNNGVLDDVSFCKHPNVDVEGGINGGYYCTECREQFESLDEIER